jgi:uridine kinase
MKEVNDKEIIEESKRLSESRKSPLIIALDGRSGTGKSTLSKNIAEKLGAAVIVGDDFYIGGTLTEWAKRNPKEKAELVIDWKRIRNEALIPLKEGHEASWYPFNWETLQGLAEEPIIFTPSKIVILDGAYSARPELADLIDVAVLLQLADPIRRQRLKEREGGLFVEEWHPVWDEAEEYYFTHIKPPETFDFIVRGTPRGELRPRP